MYTIQKVEIKAEDYPNGVKVTPLKRGDIIYFVGSHNVKVGEKYKDHPAIVSRIDYKPKRWFEFWKKKEMIGYQVLWVEDEETPSDDVDVFKNIRNLIQKE